MQQFRKNLNEDLRKVLNRIMVVFFVVFTIAILLVDAMSVNRSVVESVEHTKQIFDQIFSSYENAISITKKNQNYIDYVKHQNNEERVYQSFYSYNNQTSLSAEMLLSSIDSDIVFSTYPANQTRMLKNKYRNIDKEILAYETYTVDVVRLSNANTSLIFTSGLYDNTQLIGYVSYVYSYASFNTLISDNYYKTAVFDKFSNVLSTNSTEFVSGSLKRLKEEYQDSGIKKDENNNFIFVSIDRYRNAKISLYILNVINLNAFITSYIFGVVLFTMFFLMTWWILRRQNRLLVANRVASIEMLMSEVELIKAGDLSHRIDMDTKDEFENLANDINDMVVAIQTIASQNTELQLSRKMSEIKQLEAQLNPHFIYNTLETIRFTIQSDPLKASELILMLTKILRYSVNHAMNEVCLEEEVEFVNQYFEIMKYRYKDRLEVNLFLDENCKDVLVPKLLIQPLVENSIKYGYIKQEYLKIDILIYMNMQHIYIEVHDNGLGIEEKQLKEICKNLKNPINNQTKFGLYNINRRLFLMYANDSFLDIVSEKNMGTSILISIKHGGH
ncbi:MAG: sensor histidine kinase [Breznakia sp.]